MNVRAHSGQPPILVIGLDGGTLDLVRPWAVEGRLPNLASLMDRGLWGPLRSTLPAATFPAWTSLMTGANPGRHGIFDFTARVPGSYRVRFVNGTFRGVPTIWKLLSDEGRRVASIAMPGTYPPEPVNGKMVSGFDAPVARGIDGSFVWPPEAHREVRAVAGRLPFADVQEVNIGPDWAAHALPRLLHGIERKTALACAWLAREWDPRRNRGAGKARTTKRKRRTDAFWRHYSLWSIERACGTLREPKLGRVDWYGAGASWLLETQRKNGSWHNPEDARIATCFALLFLARRTPATLTPRDRDVAVTPTR